MVRKLWFVTVCSAVAYVLVLASAVRISAQTTQSFQYVIPHFSANAGSQLIISNLSNGNANPEIALRDSENGTLADTFITVGAGTQQRLTAASFALSSFEGSVVLTSSTRLSVLATVAVGSEFETISAFETTFDPGNPVLGASQSIIPFSQGTTGQMRLTVFNPNNAQANIVITPVQSSGLVMNSVQATVPALGTLKEDISSLFPQPVTGPLDMSHLLIRVSTSLFGPTGGVFAEAEMLNFSDPNEGIPAPRGDFSAVNAVPINNVALNGTIPFFTEGRDYATELQFINPGTATALVTLTANGTDGNPVPGTAPATLSIPPSGSVRHNVQNIFSFGAVAVDGSIQFTSTGGVIATEAIAGVSHTAFVVRPAAAQQDTNFAIPVRDFNPLFFTGLTFLNASATTAAHLTLSYVSDDGTPNSTASLTLDPTAGTAETMQILSTLMPEAQSAGFIQVQSDAPILTAALEGAYDNTVLANLPTFHPQPGYTAPTSTTFLISGTVFSNGVPLPGVAVSVTGPASLSTITDQNGNYKLSLLAPAPGVYTVTGSATGYNFSSPITVQVTGDANGNTGGSSRNNNFTAALQTPVISLVQPPGVVAGSGSTTLVVIASPISPNGQIIFDGNPLVTTLTTASPAGQTSSVSSGTGQTVSVSSGTGTTVPALQATIDSSLLNGAHQATIVVQTRDAGSIAQSQPYIWGVGTAPPVLTSFGPMPSPLAAGCCPTTAGGVSSNPGLSTTISGTGFLNGVTVQVGITSNGSNVVINSDITKVGGAVTFMSPTSIQVTIPPQFLAFGGFFNVTATNPSPSAGPSNALPLTVFNPAAIVTSLTPADANVELETNAPPLGITATGFFFAPGATMTVGGIPVPLDMSQPQTRNSISGLIPQTLIEVGATIPVTVVNPDPVAGTPVSVGLNLQNLPPVLDSIAPTNGPLTFDPTRSDEQFSAAIAVSGANFSTASVFELVNGCAPVAVSPTTVTVPVFTQRQFTAYLKGVVATSNQVTWSVTASASPSSGALGTIDVNGLYTAPSAVPNPAVVIVQATSNADPTKFAIATVTIIATPQGGASANTAVGVTLINSHQAVLTVTITCVGNYLIDVFNPQPGGGISSKLSFPVGTYQQPSTPLITSFNPPTAPGLNTPFTLTISGANFETSPNLAYISFNNTILFPTSVTSTSIVVNIPGYLITDHGNIPMAVVNPDGGSSPIASFPVF